MLRKRCLTKFVAAWSIFRAVLLGNKQTECCKVENNKKWNFLGAVWNAISVELNKVVSEIWEFFFSSFQKNGLLTCIKIQGFPIKINHCQK